MLDETIEREERKYDMWSEYVQTADGNHMTYFQYLDFLGLE